ncbi:MAG TPA: hypothetical protein P5307_21105 [Pirellulaceae bacterium]|nr:hypothetical protein [Planctomycetales bacterium]MCB9939853.1 hypothetical protein [Planctomycetaceae bacterium]HRX81587.1 hypothetical protein [Pirellulaceae bacterium]
MSNRKRRANAADEASHSKPISEESSGQPPRRNVTMLTVCLVAFAAWIAFLLYVAVFG